MNQIPFSSFITGRTSLLDLLGFSDVISGGKTLRTKTKKNRIKMKKSKKVIKKVIKKIKFNIRPKTKKVK